ncbi:TetR/AcrR family transcriptional regulator [Nocardia zapadnayensis]|uniref:TetR/AcrR family transcriptional regulator n=1 Tax=Nocardia rhamnosiphila TaxID=426716 RepID=UPI0022473BE8|nr:TetR/AcrR family transcriptional regulator [Nocardia zapadnayensis]MCX0275301.1 TetR/AcrR family transcriptional regulator [Nocardia zapadnayensis]
MARWKPNGRERLVVAALELFAEQGYDNTTIAQIAERAELTRSTFFRHFSDKREILSAGQETLSRLLVEGIDSAPADATPLTAVAAGLDAVSGAMTEFNRELGPRLHAAIEANDELRTRDAMKNIGLATAIVKALRRRGVAEATAQVAAELGMLAFRTGFSRWSNPSNDTAPGKLITYTRAAFSELRAATAELH